MTKKQAEGLKEWEKVDDKVGARRRKFLEPHLLQGTLAQKIERVKHILNTMGATRIQVRQEEREKHNERVRARNGEKRERKEYKQGKREEKEEKKREAERKEAFDNLSSYEKRLVEDPHYYHPRKIKKRKAEEEAKFDPDTFARDVRHSKREEESESFGGRDCKKDRSS